MIVSIIPVRFRAYFLNGTGYDSKLCISCFIISFMKIFQKFGAKFYDLLIPNGSGLELLVGEEEVEEQVGEVLQVAQLTGRLRAHRVAANAPLHLHLEETGRGYKENAAQQQQKCSFGSNSWEAPA